ncbi:membrane protein insertion efficiency factor YidD, partial [Dysosmobacter welbionis]
QFPRRRSLHVGTQQSTQTAGEGPGSPESHWSTRRSRRDPYRVLVIDKKRTQTPGVGPGRLHIKSSVGTPRS